MPMWRLVAGSFVVFATIAILPVRTPVLCPACVDRYRENARCEWTGDTARVLNPANAVDRRHLVADAQLAEGFAVRFADAEFGRRYGIAHHGGLIESGRIVRECQARMFSTIATMHDVGDAAIQSARAVRNEGFDWAVRLLFLPLYVLATLAAVSGVRRRFGGDGSRVWLAAMTIASLAVALLGSYLLVLWSMPWETIRVGNGHIGGYRAATYNRHGPGSVFAIAMALFWVVALLHRRVPAAAIGGAAMLSSAVLAAMFVRTFATDATVWIAVSVAQLVVVLALGRAAAFAADASAGPAPPVLELGSRTR